MPGEPVNPAIELSTITHTGAGQPPGYAREGIPTWSALEAVLGELEGGRASVFGAGIAAIDAVLARIGPGATVVVPDDAYAGLRGLLDELAGRGLVEPRPVPIADTDAVLSACQGAALLWIESPTNPLMAVADIPALCAGAHEAGALCVVDNTFATPLRQRPLDAGADVVVHSVTKFLAGHSDVLLGATVTRSQALAAELAAHRTRHGTGPGPVEAWLALRGVRTLAVRLDRAEHTAGLLAERLAAHPAVHRVRYPGLPEDPWHARAQRLMAGPGAMLSIELVGGAAAGDALCAGVRLAVHATSLGGVETSVERRAGQPHEEHVPDSLVRMSVGCEDPEDLWEDLRGALERG